MMTDFDLLNNYRRLRCIKRCNNFPTTHPEDVAQHSYYTALLTLTLSQEYNKAVEKHNEQYHPLDAENVKQKITVGNAVLKALFHDIEEAFTSDIPWNVKHHDSKIEQEMRRCVVAILNEEFTDTLSYQKQLAIDAKEGLEGEMVQLADMLEGAWFCYEEILVGNNILQDLLVKYLLLVRETYIHTVLYSGSTLYKSMYDTFYQASIGNVVNPLWGLE